MTQHLNEEQIIGYIHQTLTDAERETIDQHLTTCPPCRAHLDDHDARQRRIYYDLSADLRLVHPSARMSFAAIAPQVKRSRRYTMFVIRSNQLISGAIAIVLLVALGIGLVVLLNNGRWPVIGPKVVSQPVTNPDKIADQPLLAPPESSQPDVTLPIGELQWTFEAASDVNASPTVVDGVLYFGSDDHQVYAVDSQTGQEIWRFDTGSPVRSAPTVAEGVVYVGSGCTGNITCIGGSNQDNSLFALNSQSGQELWRFKTEMGVDSSPTIAEGVVYFGSYDRHVYAVDSQTGQELWRFEAEDMVLSSPAVVDNMVYFGSGCFECALFEGEHTGQSLYAVNSQTGQELWRFDTGGPVESSPTVVDGAVYFGSHDRHLYALNSQTGQEKWRFKTFGLITSSPAVADGLVYVTSHDGQLYAVDSQTGQEKWRFKTYMPLDSSPWVAAGVVYFGSGSDGYLYAVDAQTGRELWKFKANEAVYTSPAVADGVVYFGSEDNHLYAVR